MKKSTLQKELTIALKKERERLAGLGAEDLLIKTLEVMHDEWVKGVAGWQAVTNEAMANK